MASWWEKVDRFLATTGMTVSELERRSGLRLNTLGKALKTHQNLGLRRGQGLAKGMHQSLDWLADDSQPVDPPQRVAAIPALLSAPLEQRLRELVREVVQQELAALRLEDPQAKKNQHRR